MYKHDIVMINLHGRVSYNNMELGIDLDTGGQTKYVIEMTKNLSKNEKINKVYLFTRLILDKNINSSYGIIEEKINAKASIIRLPCGPTNKYLFKEELWPYIWEYVDEAYNFIKKNKIKPLLIHGHYAESAEIASYLANMLNIKSIITAHSLGRRKLNDLLKNNISLEKANKKFKILRRIEAEETALENSNLVICNSKQELDNQWNIYDNFRKNLLLPETKIISAGVDVMNDYTVSSVIEEAHIIKDINSFYFKKEKPIIYALSRPSSNKNIEGILRAYGESKELQDKCNLLLILGNRTDINELNEDSYNVLINTLILIDKYNLYGKVAYPKNHTKSDIPIIYNYVKKLNGIFINIAFEEPFGLTLIEAAQFGLPVIATINGGPNDILAVLNNGILVNPKNTNEIIKSINYIITNKEIYEKFSENANLNYKYFSWENYSKKYLNIINNFNIDNISNNSNKNMMPNFLKKSDKILFTDIDNTLLGNKKASDMFIKKTNKKKLHLALTSGRDFNSIKQIIKENDINIKRFIIIISSVGTEIHIYSENKQDYILDEDHAAFLDFRWEPEKLSRYIETNDYLKKQTHDGSQSYFKLSFDIINNKFDFTKYKKELRQNGFKVNIIKSSNKHLDFIPIRASKGKTLRYIINKYNLKFNNIVVSGDSGNDEDMMTGKIKSIVVGNYMLELEHLKERNNVYFSNKTYANGIVDGLEYYGLI